MITGLTHPGISVSNLENWLAFIRNNLNANHISSQISDQDYLAKVTGFPGAKLKIGFIKFSEHSFPLEVIEYLHPKGKMQTIPYGVVGYAHLAFLVKNIDALHALNKENGLSTSEIINLDHPYWGNYRSYRLLAPDNIPIKILSTQNSSKTFKDDIQIHHSGLTVSDLKEAEKLLSKVLDLEVVYRGQQTQDCLAPDLNTVYQYVILKIPTHDFWVELRQFNNTTQKSEIDMGHNHFGSMHHCFQVDDIFNDYAILKDAGVNFFGLPAQVTAGINQGAFAIYFCGFDGYRFEIFQKPHKN
jgi:catechol 2,3-dioxygenase-like lactoylglutathione lyase family enzyme